MPDPFEVHFEIAFHFHGHPILEKIFFLSQKLRGQGPQALFGILTIGCTTEIHVRIDKPVAALTTFSGGVIFEELHGVTTFWALGFKDGIRFPEAAVLSGAFHGYSSTKFLISRRIRAFLFQYVVKSGMNNQQRNRALFECIRDR